MITRYLIWGGFALFFSGCATIYGRQNDEARVFFDADVPSVEVTCSGEMIETPGNLELRQSRSHVCRAAREGYVTQTFRIRSEVTKRGFQYSTDVNWQRWGKWTLGLGNLVAWPVDFVSGAMRDLSRDRVILEMQEQDQQRMASRILDKATDTGKALVALPKDVVDNTTSVVLDQAVRAPSEQTGISSAEQREETEQVVEGKKAAKRLDSEQT